jgi:hypothetical protein
LTKCVAAVGIGAARPLSAVAAVGISGFFLAKNMIGSCLVRAPPTPFGRALPYAGRVPTKS